MTDRITELNKELWDSRAGTYDRAFRFNRWVQKKIVSLLVLDGAPYLLELACGTGWALRYAAGLAPGHGELYGIDLSAKMIERAQQKSSAYRNIHFIRANAEKLPFHNSLFTSIVCTNSFHHFSNPGGVIAESARVLKSDGRVYIADPSGDDIIVRSFDRLQRKLEPAHVKTYSTREYLEFFQAAGLVYMERKRILPALKIHVAQKS